MQAVLDILGEYWPGLPERHLAHDPAGGDRGRSSGSLLAVPVALARLSENRIVHGLATAYSLFFRGTPLLVQIFLIYFGLGQFDFVRRLASSGRCCARPMSAR